MAFKQIFLKTGEARSDYIRRRYAEGASAKTITREINSPEFYSGPEGKSWSRTVVDGLKPKEKAIDPDRLVGESHPPRMDDMLPAPEDLLSPEEKEQIRKEALAAVIAEKKADAKKVLMDREKARISGTTGMRTGDPRKDEIVWVSINLPEFVDRIQINIPHGPVFMHGRRYPVPRHVGDTLREQQQRLWDHHAETKGEKRGVFRPRNYVISGGEGTGTGAQVTGAGITV